MAPHRRRLGAHGARGPIRGNLHRSQSVPTSPSRPPLPIPQLTRIGPTVDEADTPEYVQKRDSWVSAKLAPVLHAVSIRVPRKTTVSICLTQTAEVLTDYPTDVLDRYCAAYGHDQRGVSFVRAHLPGPLKNVPTGAGECMAVHPVRFTAQDLTRPNN